MKEFLVNEIDFEKISQILNAREVDFKTDNQTVIEIDGKIDYDVMLLIQQYIDIKILNQKLETKKLVLRKTDIDNFNKTVVNKEDKDLKDFEIDLNECLVGMVVEPLEGKLEGKICIVAGKRENQICLVEIRFDEKNKEQSKFHRDIIFWDENKNSNLWIVFIKLNQIILNNKVVMKCVGYVKINLFTNMVNNAMSEKYISREEVIKEIYFNFVEKQNVFDLSFKFMPKMEILKSQNKENVIQDFLKFIGFNYSNREVIKFLLQVILSKQDDFLELSQNQENTTAAKQTLKDYERFLLENFPAHHDVYYLSINYFLKFLIKKSDA